MSSKTVVTICRQYGSGGHDIGRKLANRMGVNLYDKEILKMASRESGICEDVLKQQDEKPTNSFLYSLVMDTYSFGGGETYNEMPLNQRAFLSEYDVIKKIGHEQSCVIVGRCADFALEDYDEKLNIFIMAPLKDRIKRIMRRHDLSDKKAEALIHKTDKKRKQYYEYYSNKKWGDVESYDMTINSAVFGEDGCVDVIMDAIKAKDAKYSGI